MNPRKLIIFTDSGDTIIDEGSQIFDERGVVIHANVIPGADRTLHALHDAGYRIALVADGRTESFRNVMTENGLWELFDTKTISEELNTQKPDPLMFTDAMTRNNLCDEDKRRIIMVGNNLERDIRGANRFGITSVLIDWSPRYDMRPGSDEDTPDYIIHKPEELLRLAERLDSLL